MDLHLVSGSEELADMTDKTDASDDVSGAFLGGSGGYLGNRYNPPNKYLDSMSDIDRDSRKGSSAAMQRSGLDFDYCSFLNGGRTILDDEDGLFLESEP